MSLQRAFDRVMKADTGKVVLALDADDGEVINVPPASMAAMYVDQFVLVKQVAGPATLAWKVTRVYELDVPGNKVKLDPPLPATPLATDELLYGVTTWLKGGNTVKYRRPAYSTPVQKLLDDQTRHECVVLYGEKPRDHMFCEAWNSQWEFRSVSKSSRHAEGCAERVKTLLQGATPALQAVAKGIVMQSLVVNGFQETERDDKNYEFVVRAHVDVARKVA